MLIITFALLRESVVTALTELGVKLKDPLFVLTTAVSRVAPPYNNSSVFPDETVRYASDPVDVSPPVFATNSFRFKPTTVVPKPGKL